MPISIKYHFTLAFNVPVQKTFDWCTNFDLNDHQLMGEQNAKREIINLANGALILKDTFHLSTEVVEKQKLVRLYPEKYTWTSTHLNGPNKYSQFLYELASVGKESSILDFSGLHLEYQRIVDEKLLTQKLCKEDAKAWKLLAKAMEKEIGSKK